MCEDPFSKGLTMRSQGNHIKIIIDEDEVFPLIKPVFKNYDITP